MMTRLAVFDRFGSYIGDLAENDVFEAMRHAVENGEDSLTVSTTAYLAKGQRILYRDAMLRWHEHIVAGGDEAHDSGRSAVGEYYCESSWAELRTAPLIIDKRPGQSAPVQASAALAAALDGTRWQVGEVDVTTLASARWHHVSPWEAVVSVVETWGGYLRADIEVGPTGVESRKLSLVKSLGTGAGVRLDYGRDVSSIRATYDESDVYTALYCYGKGVETDSGGYGRKIGIESVNGGVPYVEDADAKQVWGQMGPDGLDNAYGVFEDGDIEDPATLKQKGLDALADAARPKVQYEATVEQFARAGTDLRGAGLGDRVDVVDRSFYRERHGVDADLRLTGHVVEVTEDLLDPSSTQVVVGDVMGTVADQLAGLQGSVDKLTGSAPTWTDAATNATAYVNDLIDRLNQEINATGGYTYVKPGEGIWVYDKAEDQNPTKVINLMGGSMRIADSKTSDGEWDWRSVFVSGHVAADLVTAVHVTAGTIRSADGTILIDLDNGRATIGGYVSDDTLQATIERTEDGILSTVSETYATQEGVTNEISTAITQASGKIQSTVEQNVMNSVGDTFATKTELTQTEQDLTLTINQSLANGYATCGTTAGTIAKVATCTNSNFSLKQGFNLAVKFTYANTATNPTLNVNGTGAKNIRLGNVNITPELSWEAGDTVLMVYDGTYWQVADAAMKSAKTVESYFIADSTGLTVGQSGEPSAVKMNSNGRFQVLNNGTNVFDMYYDSNSGATIKAPMWDKVTVSTSNSSLMEISNMGLRFSSFYGGFTVGGVAAVENYYYDAGGTTGLVSFDLAGKISDNIRRAVIYYHCNWNIYDYKSVCVEITNGQSIRVDLTSISTGTGPEQIAICVEPVTVSLSGQTMRISRGDAYRASISSSGAGFNANPSPSALFRIDGVGVCIGTNRNDH